MFNNTNVREVFQSTLPNDNSNPRPLGDSSISSRWTCCLIGTLVGVAILVGTAVLVILILSDRKMNKTELLSSKCSLDNNGAMSSEIAAQILSYPFLLAPYEVTALLSIYDGDLDGNGSIPTPCTNLIASDKCLKSFYMLISISLKTFPSTLNEFMAMVGAKIIADRGFVNVCKNVRWLQNCNEYGRSCFQVKAFLRMNYTSHYSYFLSQWIGQVTYLCQAIRKINSTKQIDCLAKSAWKHNSIAVRCKSEFSECLRTHGPQQHCRCSQHLLSCEEEVVNDECGEKTGNLACEVVRHGLQNLFAIDHIDEDKECPCTSSIISSLKSANLTAIRLEGIIDNDDDYDANEFNAAEDARGEEYEEFLNGVENYVMADGA